VVFFFWSSGSFPSRFFRCSSCFPTGHRNSAIGRIAVFCLNVLGLTSCYAGKRGCGHSEPHPKLKQNNNNHPPPHPPPPPPPLPPPPPPHPSAALGVNSFPWIIFSFSFATGFVLASSFLCLSNWPSLTFISFIFITDFHPVSDSPSRIRFFSRSFFAFLEEKYCSCAWLEYRACRVIADFLSFLLPPLANRLNVDFSSLLTAFLSYCYNAVYTRGLSPQSLCVFLD